MTEEEIRSNLDEVYKRLIVVVCCLRDMQAVATKPKHQKLVKINSLIIEAVNLFHVADIPTVKVVRDKLEEAGEIARKLNICQTFGDIARAREIVQEMLWYSGTKEEEDDDKNC